MTTTRRFTDAILTDEMATLLRAKSPAQRLAIAFELWKFARQLMEQTARSQHPDWTEPQLQAHLARRMSGGTV